MDIRWLGTLDYEVALGMQESLQLSRIAGEIPDTLLLLEHSPVITMGRRASLQNIVLSEQELIEKKVKVVEVNRGGDVTYHGPGQLVGYLIFDLREHGRDIKQFIQKLEGIFIKLLSLPQYSLRAHSESGRHTGIFVGNDKLVAFGISVKQWVTMHGFAFNISTELSHFEWIIPCGLIDRGVTSLAAAASKSFDIEKVANDLAQQFRETFEFQNKQIVSEADFKEEAKGNTPEWLRARVSAKDGREEMFSLISRLSLNTVCEEANCPNLAECFSRGTATFMILGSKCTRRCTFCNVLYGAPALPDPDEPIKVAEAVSTLKLKHTVITSVTRDDLADGGASVFAETVHQIRLINPSTTIEVLVPDFLGDKKAIDRVLEAKPAVFAHNIETVSSLYPEVRLEAVYERSLSLLLYASKSSKALRYSNDLELKIEIKSGFMLGLGETDTEVEELLDDLRDAGCTRITIGQYLSPTSSHAPVKEYIRPEKFLYWEKRAYSRGFSHVASGPLVRSSYHAEEGLNTVEILK